MIIEFVSYIFWFRYFKKQIPGSFSDFVSQLYWKMIRELIFFFDLFPHTFPGERFQYF